MNYVVIKSRSKPLSGDWPPILGAKSIFHLPSIVIPKKLSRRNKYYAIEVLPPHLIDKAEFHGLPSDSMAIVGVLASSFFPIWVEALSEREVTTADESSNAYNNFPFPDLTRKQQRILEEKVGKVFQARSSCTFNKLSDIYSAEPLPEHLLIAHEDLDDVLLDIFNLPSEATNAEILEALMKRYATLTK